MVVAAIAWHVPCLGMLTNLWLFARLSFGHDGNATDKSYNMLSKAAFPKQDMLSWQFLACKCSSSTHRDITDNRSSQTLPVVPGVLRIWSLV